MALTLKVDKSVWLNTFQHKPRHQSTISLHHICHFSSVVLSFCYVRISSSTFRFFPLILANLQLRCAVKKTYDETSLTERTCREWQMASCTSEKVRKDAELEALLNESSRQTKQDHADSLDGDSASRLSHRLKSLWMIHWVQFKLKARDVERSFSTCKKRGNFLHCSDDDKWISGSTTIIQSVKNGIGPPPTHQHWQPSPIFMTRSRGCAVPIWNHSRSSLQNTIDMLERAD